MIIQLLLILHIAELNSAQETKSASQPRNCSKADTVCLQGGPRGKQHYMGNVMIGGLPVCDDDWNLINAYVVCKELGFTTVVDFYRKSKFGNVSSDYRMDNVKCNGTEKRLLDCKHTSKDNCGVNEAAGVECDARDFSNILNSTCFELDVFYTFRDNVGTTKNVKSAADCQTICKNSPSCKHFSYKSKSKKCYLKSGNSKSFEIGTISGPKLCRIQSIKSNSYDSKHTRASDSPTARHTKISVTSSTMGTRVNTATDSRKTKVDDKSGSGFSKDNAPATVEFPQLKHIPLGKIQLAQGESPHEGNVYMGSRPICGQSWTTQAARVVCRELGFEDVLAIYHYSFFVSINGNPTMKYVDNTTSVEKINNNQTLNDNNGDDIAMIDIECKGHEVSLRLCNFLESKHCDLANIAGVKCENDTLIDIPQACYATNKTCLLGGSGDHEGNIYFQGKPVCDDSWTYGNAQIACKSLGFKEAMKATRGSDFGMVPSEFSGIAFDCYGAEENLQNCRIIKRESKCNYNRHQGAGVICSRAPALVPPALLLIINLSMWVEIPDLVLQEEDDFVNNQEVVDENFKGTPPMLEA